MNVVSNEWSQMNWSQWPWNQPHVNKLGDLNYYDIKANAINRWRDILKPMAGHMPHLALCCAHLVL